MTVALLITLIVTNAVWLWYLHGRDKRDQLERYQLLERQIAPGVSQPTPGVLSDLETTKVMDIPVVEDEFDLVGEINPATPLRSDG